MPISGQCCVLLANGEYKAVEAVCPGDLVLNMHQKPVSVTAVKQVTASDIIEIKHTNWYQSTVCGKDQQFLVQETAGPVTELKWVAAEKLQKGTISDGSSSTKGRTFFSSEMELYKDLATSATWQIGTKKVTPTKQVGELFGLYAGYGTICGSSNAEYIEFRFGPNNDLVNNVAASLTTVMDAVTTIEKDEYSYRVKTSTPAVVDFFRAFGSKIAREIPRNLWVNVPEYTIGIFQGLVEFDPKTKISRFIPVSEKMAQAFAWVCNVNGIVFEHDTPKINKTAEAGSVPVHGTFRVWPLFVRHDQPEGCLSTVQSVSDRSNETNEKLWTVTTSDNEPFSTIIVNGLVARGD